MKADKAHQFFAPNAAANASEKMGQPARTAPAAPRSAMAKDGLQLSDLAKVNAAMEKTRDLGQLKSLLAYVEAKKFSPMERRALHENLSSRVVAVTDLKGMLSALEWKDWNGLAVGRIARAAFDRARPVANDVNALVEFGMKDLKNGWRMAGLERALKLMDDPKQIGAIKAKLEKKLRQSDDSLSMYVERAIRQTDVRLYELKEKRDLAAGERLLKRL